MFKKLFFSFLTFAFAGSAFVVANPLQDGDISHEIPEITLERVDDGFEKVKDVAQYKGADWSNALGIARSTTLAEAKEIANSNPDITFFFYTKGWQMVLEREDGSYRLFHHGDAVFFSGEPWWGSAPGLADGYVKTMSIQN